MKYNIYINQKAVIDNGWDLNINHLAVLDCIVGMIETNQLETLEDEGHRWYYISAHYINKNLPLLNIKVNRLRKLINELEDCFLISKYKHNQFLGKSYLRLNSNYFTHYKNY